MIALKITNNDFEAKLVDVNSLEDYYREMDCDCVDFYSFEHMGYNYTAIIDDNGKYISTNFTTAIIDTGYPVAPYDKEELAGTILILRTDRSNEDSGCKSIEREDIDRLTKGLALDVYPFGLQLIFRNTLKEEK